LQELLKALVLDFVDRLHWRHEKMILYVPLCCLWLFSCLISDWLVPFSRFAIFQYLAAVCLQNPAVPSLLWSALFAGLVFLAVLATPGYGLSICLQCLHGVCGGGRKRGRPVGSKSKSSGDPTRESNRQRIEVDYSETRQNSDSKNKRQRHQVQAKRATHGRKTKRGHSAIRKSRKGRTKDRKRAKEAENRKQLRASFAKEIRDSISGIVIEMLSHAQLKQLVLLAFYTVLSKVGSTRQMAADIASDIYHVHAETVKLWARTLEAALLLDGPGCDSEEVELADKLRKCESFWHSLRSRHAKTVWLLSDVDKQEQAKEWIRQHKSQQKGVARMKVADFCRFLNDKLLANEIEDRETPISETTAKVYLHRLGFIIKRAKKGIDVKAHERPDVVKRRKQFLRALAEEIDRGKRPGERPVIVIYQDETVFMVFDSDKMEWCEADEDSPVLRKGGRKGKGLMRSEFITRENGLLLGASLVLDYSEDGFFDSDQFLDQVCTECSRCVLCGV
jgi:hypothetical protein